MHAQIASGLMEYARAFIPNLGREKICYTRGQPICEVVQPALVKRFPALLPSCAGKRFASAGCTTSQIGCPLVNKSAAYIQILHIVYRILRCTKAITLH